MNKMTTQLAEAVEKWLNGRRSRSLGMLARMSDTSYSTVRRLMSGEITINRETAISIAGVVMIGEPLKEYINEHWPALNKCLVSVHYDAKELEDNSSFLTSQDHLSVILLSSKSGGVGKAEVRDRLGERGLLALSELVDAKVIGTSQNGTYALEMVPNAPSMPLARQMLARCAEAFNLGAGPGVPATAWVGWESLNPEAAKRCNAILAEAVESVFAIMKDQDNNGPVLVSMGVMLNTISGMEAFS